MAENPSKSLPQDLVDEGFPAQLLLGQPVAVSQRLGVLTGFLRIP